MSTGPLPVVFAPRMNYTDADLTFLVQTRHDAEPLAWTLGHLRTHYPQARVILRSDGDDNPVLPGIAAKYGAEFYSDPWMYALERGGELVHRWLDLFLLRPTQYFFKIDTDTGIHRRFKYLPTHPGLFGTLQGNTRLISIQGGCNGFTLAAAMKMFESRAFLDPSLREPQRSWACDPGLMQYIRTRNKVSDDWLVGYVATALSLPIYGFPEVACTWKQYIPNANLRFAITHPCKGMTL